MSAKPRSVGEHGPPEKILLVEGENDRHVFWNLLDARGIDNGLRVEDGKGYERLRRSLPRRLQARNETHLGIVVDADGDFGNRWRSIRDALVGSGYVNIPDALSKNGGVFHRGDLDAGVGAEPPYNTIVGLWIMPDNSSPGMIEDFARSLVYPADRLWQRAVDAVAAIPEGDRRFVPRHAAKAHVHTWLAWQETPGEPIGRAIKTGVLDADAELAALLIDWLRRLFELGP